MKGHNKGCGLLPDLFGKGGKSCCSSLVRQLKQKGFERNDGDKGYADPSNEGIGGRLIKAMLTLLKGQGYEKVSLSVHPENEAIRLYERLGFQTDLIQNGDCRMVKWL